MKVSEYVDYLATGECSKLAIASVGDMSAKSKDFLAHKAGRKKK